MPQDEDFLSVRLGLGEHPFETTIKCPPKGFVLEEDSMVDKALELGERYSKMQGIPMVLSLMEKRVVGVVGQRDKIMETLRCMILGICVQHSYDEVKIVLVCNRAQSREVEYAFELPHIWSADHTVRYLAQTKEEVQGLFSGIDESLQERETLLEKESPPNPSLCFLCSGQTFNRGCTFNENPFAGRQSGWCVCLFCGGKIRFDSQRVYCHHSKRQ